MSLSLVDVSGPVDGPAPQPDWGFSFYRHPDDVPGSAQARFQWCISPMALKKLKDKGYDLSCVVIVAVDENGREDRYLAPLSALQALIQFRKTGRYWVHAHVVGQSRSEWTMHHMRKRYLKKDSPDHYSYTLFNIIEDDAGKMIPVADREIGDYSTASLVQFDPVKVAVDVDHGEFATPLPPWLHWYANFAQKEEYHDTCEVRRRIPHLIFIKPFILLVWGVFKILYKAVQCAAVTVVILGILTVAFVQTFVLTWPGVQWRRMFTSLDWFDTRGELKVLSASKRSWLVYDGYHRRPYWQLRTLLLPWMHVVIIMISAPVVMLWGFFTGSPPFSAEHSVTLWWQVYLGIVAMYFVFAGIGVLFGMLFKKISEANNDYYRDQSQLWEAEKQARRKRAQARVVETLSEVVCGDQAGRRARMPAFTVTNPAPALRVWMQDLKAKGWCKPYAAR